MSVLCLFTFMYRTCPEFGHNVSFNGFLHLYCFLHCRWTLKTSELWNNTYGTRWYTKNLFYISDSFAFTALHTLHSLSCSWGRHLEWFFHCCGTIFCFPLSFFFFSLSLSLFLTWPVEMIWDELDHGVKEKAANKCSACIIYIISFNTVGIWFQVTTSWSLLHNSICVTS